MKNLKVGDWVWFDSGYIEKAQVLELIKSDSGTKAKLRNTYIPSVCVMPVKSLYRSERACRQAMQDRSNALINSYTKEIRTVEDLIRFCFDYNIGPCCDIQEHEAREAAKIKAKELLGIIIE